MSTSVVRAATSRVRLGHARVDMTPPVGIYHRMWGAARHDRATGVHRPLYGDVVALGALDGTGVGHVRVCLDLVGLAPAQHAAVVRAVAEGAGVAEERVMVTHSHTHSAGWLVPDRMSLPGGELIAPYLSQLGSRLGEAAKQAAEAMREVTITYGQGSCRMAANRDYWDDARGAFSCGFNPDARAAADPGLVADDTLLAVRVTDVEGKLVVTLVNYACHPTTLAWENTLLSPDFPGALRETVQQATGAPCVYVQGACGDLGPRRGFTGDTAVADANGREVGYAALSALTAMGPPATDYRYAGAVVSGATLGVWEDAPFGEARGQETARFEQAAFTVELPLKPLPKAGELQTELAEWERRQREADAAGETLVARDYGARAERARRWLGRIASLPDGPEQTTYPLHVTLLQLGDAVWVTTGGEPYSALQVALRRRFSRLMVLVSPLAGGMQVAYLLRRECYGTGRYQEEPSMLAPGCLEQLTEAIAARIETLGS